MIIDIIGAGIGGLTTAIALQKEAFELRIYEQAPQIKALGAGILLGHNAMQVYRHLGLQAELESLGQALKAFSITESSLKPISQIALDYFDRKYGVQNIAIHRGDLQKTLMKSLSKPCIYLQKKLVDIGHSSDFILKFADGSQTKSKIMIGADGIHSKVRKIFFDNPPLRRAFQMCWRGVAPFQLPPAYQHQLTEAWGMGDRFGFVQIAPQKVYWYALMNFKQEDHELHHRDLDCYFRAYDPLVLDLIRSTAFEDIHSEEIYDLSPLSTWFKDGVCLLGDAAHASTPNLGQGAAQSIEDAFMLARCLVRYPLPRAFQVYQQKRKPKARKVVQTSWYFGKMAHLQHPWAARFRNTLLKMSPESWSRKKNDFIYELAVL